MGRGVKEAVALLNPHCNERENGKRQVSAGCCAASLSAFSRDSSIKTGEARPGICIPQKEAGMISLRDEKLVSPCVTIKGTSDLSLFNCLTIFGRRVLTQGNEIHSKYTFQLKYWIHCR